MRVQQGPSSAATLFLIANTMMTTATMTSIAWYLFHSTEMQRKNGADSVAPAGAIAWPPREYAPTTRPEPAAPQKATASLAQLIGPEVFEVAAGSSALIPFELQDIPESADHVSARGLPSDISFNKGKRSSASSWTIPLSGLPGLELVAASSTPLGNADLAFIVLTQDGRLLASAAMTLTVTSASAGTASAPTPPAPVDSAVLARQVAKGREFLAIGQVGAARLVLQRAASSGSADAALLLGDTYDPVRLFQLGARGLVGDVSMATSWYEKADALGASEAKARIESVGKK